MNRRAGRPARPTSIDPDLLAAADRALTQMGKALGLPSSRYPDPATGRLDRRPNPLALAVVAIQAQEALEVLAAREVELARDREGLTWEQVGDAFDITAQSAHHRFANRPSNS